MDKGLKDERYKFWKAYEKIILCPFDREEFIKQQTNNADIEGKNEKFHCIKIKNFGLGVRLEKK